MAGSFALASVLTLLALVTLIIKVSLERTSIPVVAEAVGVDEGEGRP